MKRLLIPFLVAAAMLAALSATAAMASTPLTLILDNQNNSFGSITLDGIYRNGGFEYVPAEPQWSSAHYRHLQNGRYVNISEWVNCPTNLCQHTRDYGSHDWFRQGVWRSTAIPAGQKAWLLDADVFVEAHNENESNHHGIALGYTVGPNGYSGGAYSFSDLPAGLSQVRQACVDIPSEAWSGGTYPSRIYIGKLPGSVNGQDTGSYFVDNITINTIDVSCDSYEPPAPPPPPTTEGNPPFAITATCGITTTTLVISGTENITHTEFNNVAANIVQNPSFEDVASGQPNYWTVDPAYTVVSTDNPSEGARSLVFKNTPPLTILQNFGALPTVPPTVTWRIGLQYQEGSYDFLGALAVGEFEIVGMNAIPPALLHYTTTTGYAPIDYTLNMSNVVDLADGSLYGFKITMPDLGNLPVMAGNAPHYIDEVYVIPAYEDGEGWFVYCPAVAEYEPPDPVVGGGGTDPVEGVGGLPVPIGGAGETCWECRWPAGRGVEMAIAWLGCVIRNMFSCSLRLWLYAILNAIMGVYATLLGYIQWGAFSAQGGINWTAELVQNGANWLNGALAAIQPGTVAGGTSIWDVLYAIARIIPDSLEGLVGIVSELTGLISVIIGGAFTIISLIGLALYSVLGLLVQILIMIFQLIPVLWQAISAEPVTMQDWLTSTGNEVPYDGLVTFVWSIGVVDEWLVVFNIHWILWILTGGIVINVILWIKEEFSRQWF